MADKENRKMTARLLTIVLAACACLLAAAPGAFGAAPALKLTVSSQPTNFSPGSEPIEVGDPNAWPQYSAIATNVGSAPTKGPITFTDTVPTGLTPVAPLAKDFEGVGDGLFPLSCSISGQKVTCTVLNSLQPGQWAYFLVPVKVDPDASGTLTNEVSVEGGGAAEATASTTTTISSAFPSFDFVPGTAGFSATATANDGQPATQAGSHPYGLTIDLGFPTAEENRGPLIQSNLYNANHLRDLKVTLPRGMVVNPNAAPARCTEAQLESQGGAAHGGCPVASQVGVVSVLTNVGVGLSPQMSAIYNMVPPPGVAAELAFNAAEVGIFIHLKGGVNAAGEYELGTDTNSIIAKPGNPVVGVQAQLWGSPTDPSHDAMRVDCAREFQCSIRTQRLNTPFITMPSSCRPSLSATATTDSWEDPAAKKSRGTTLEDPASGLPTGTDGCNQLDFAPAIAAKPTTNLSDAPTGLDFSLHVPQAPVVEGTPGRTISCFPGTWSGNPTSYSYQWLRNGTPIPGATSDSYPSQDEDAGTALQCEVSAANGAIGPGHAAGNPAVLLPAPSTPLPASAEPILDGSLSNEDDEETITCKPGAWSGSPTFSYQWLRNGSPLPGETADTYVLAPGETPLALSCEVLGTNAAGTVVAFSDNAESEPPLDPSLPDSKVAPVAFLSASNQPPATANFKDVKVTFPPGMAVNPSGANGLGACTPAQFGLTSGVGNLPVRTDANRATCPDNAKIGSVEVSTPLLDHPLPGALYVAQPFQNPFGSLLAIYLTVYDEQSGVVSKLAGKVEADPQTGQLTTTFSDNPELPIEDVKLSVFGGPRSVLKTPLACGNYSIASDITPWSTPEGATEHPSDSFATGVAASGSGPCPSSEATAPNNPSFSAGTLAPQAGAYSPFLLKLSRADGTQRLTGLEATLPKGLIGKLAGTSYCSEAQIAVAKSREAPNQGALEQASPSCPLSSEVGNVTVGAGAGITPLYVQGKAYLAGPYKGAPVSFVFITPAVAGPYDLGSVVARAPAYIDSETAQVHVVSDPLPTILQGIPVDIRSVAVKVDRPEFTLNPTSCDPMAILASATAATGQSAALSNPFQVGGCSALKFKPKLALSLKGATKRTGHPALEAVLTYPKGAYANTAYAQVTLPHSAFLDTTHIKTICTRVQFAADACPKASIYGFVRATTPLLDQPVKGPIYLRSSSHKLPDLVLALDGQVDVDAVGRVDTGKAGGIRTTFEAVPDAPITKVVLEMQGGKKGLFVNSENLCAKTQKAIADFKAQNGKVLNTRPVIANGCKAKAKKSKPSKARH